MVLKVAKDHVSLFLVLWVLLQGFFGYLTVSLKLWPQIVTAHLLLGFLTASIIWLLYFRLLDEDNKHEWNFSSYTKRIIIEIGSGNGENAINLSKIYFD